MKELTDKEIYETRLKNFFRKYHILQNKFFNEQRKLRKAYSKISRLNKKISKKTPYIKTYCEADLKEIKFSEKEIKDLIKNKKIAPSLFALFYIMKHFNEKVKND